MGKAVSTIKNVLIVDDEKLFLKSVTDGLKPFEKKNKFRTLTAANGREALQILESQEVTLLITDLRMPEMDGISLISRVHNDYPSVPVIVMTAFGSPEIERQVKELGILHYLEKPIGFDEFRDHILNELSQKKKGRIEGVTLASFLQLLWMEKATCTLTVKSPSDTGILTIRNGELINAEIDEEQGIEAALSILAWPDTSIEMEDTINSNNLAFLMSIEELLLESFRRQDEENNAPSIEYEDFEAKSSIDSLDDGGRAQTPARGKAKEGEKRTKIEAKEERMNVQKLKQSIETLKENLGGGLLATDIFGSADMQSIAGFNSNPAACALFGQIILSTNRALKESGFPILGRYCLFDLVDGKMVVLIPMGDYIWGMLIDGKQAQLGLLLNIALPKAIAAFEDAITS
ncbi:MAG: response regulator [Candidatus Aminicenantes bacterium]|nr:response regulator [Candidatus Aminicenantes bacterium]